MNNITTDELKARLDSGETPHIIDVREEYERADFNIGGTHIPLGKLQSMQLDDIEEWDKDDEIILYCRSGNRSGIAAHMLEMLGYNNVKNLVGGMIDWNNKNLGKP